MSSGWLNFFLRFSGMIFLLKQKVVEAKSWVYALYYAFLLLIIEILFVLVSFPLYLLVSPEKLQERGIVFPLKEKEPARFSSYIVRRKISLTTVFGAGGVFLFKFVFISLVSSYLLGVQMLLAANQDWTFDVSGDYTYDSAKIEITGGTAQLKPIYGQITNSVINTLEFDTANGMEPDIINVSGSVYAIVYAGVGNDGFVKTVTVNSSGVISAVIDVLEYDTLNGFSSSIIHVSGDIYAVAYEGDASDGFIKTFSIDAGGNIGAAVIDTLEFDTVQALFNDLIHISGDIYAIAYEGSGSDGYVSTVSIDAGGNIGAAVIDTLEFDIVNGSEPHIINVGAGYYAISYSGSGTDGFVVTVGIDSLGNVSNAVVDSLEFDINQGLSSEIINVSGTVYAIAYEGVGSDGFLTTVNIDAGGNIGAAVIDTLEFDIVQALFVDIINIAPNTFAIVYEGSGNDGYVVTVNMDAGGNIGAAVIDTLEFNTVGGRAPKWQFQAVFM